MKKIIAILLMISIFGSVVPARALAEIPKTMGENKTFALNILEKLPEAIKNVWQNQALPIWRNMWAWSKSFWETALGSKVRSLWEKLWGLTDQETPDLENEFQKEKEEMQKDLWERFKDLF